MTAVQEILPSQRLDQIIGTTDPSPGEAHDMAVELLNWRMAHAAAQASSPAHVDSTRVRLAKAMCEQDGFRWLPIDESETANGETPEQQREYWLDKADVALAMMGGGNATTFNGIKPLVWTGTEGGPGNDIYATPSGYLHYTVRHLQDGRFDVILGTDIGSLWFAEETDAVEHVSYTSAKAFVEQDYRKRAGSYLCQEERS